MISQLKIKNLDQEPNLKNLVLKDLDLGLGFDIKKLSLKK